MIPGHVPQKLCADFLYANSTPKPKNHRNTRKIKEAASGRVHEGVGRLRVEYWGGGVLEEYRVHIDTYTVGIRITVGNKLEVQKIHTRFANFP